MITKSGARVLFAGGGTGGHVFPLLALAEAFARLAPSLELVFVGTERGLEARVVPERGFVLETLPIEPLKGRSIFGALKGGVVAAAATARATAIVMKKRPRLVVSIGGYAAGPVSLAAAALGVPVVLLEPNRTAGLTQKLLAPVAKRIYVGFAEAGSTLGDKARALGVPLREGFMPTAPRAAGETIHILIMGGSQGAEHLNQTLPAAISRLAQTERLRVTHQAGRGRDAEVKKRYEQAFASESARAIAADATEDDLERARRKGERNEPKKNASPQQDSGGPQRLEYGEKKLEVTVTEFIADVPAALAGADFVVARSGALTCAELCAIGRPAILVPYPFAADDHQAANAEALAGAGAAIAIRQEKADVAALHEAMRTLCRDPKKRAAMTTAARARGVPDAATRITRELLEDFLHMPSGQSDQNKAQTKKGSH